MRTIGQFLDGIGERIGLVARFGRWGVLPHYLFAILVIMTLVFATVLPVNRLVAEGRREDEIRREIDEVRANSAELRKKIDRLNDPRVIESEARARLGLVRPGETPLIVTEGPLPQPGPSAMKPKPKPNPRPPTSTATPVKTSPRPGPSKTPSSPKRSPSPSASVRR